MTDSSSSAIVTSRALWDARPTTGKRSERFLANALGYPRSWRVVRRRLDVKASTIIVDRIYAGAPEEGVDVYLNHMAAQAAAVDWEDGVSTGKEHKGGQLLPRKPLYSKGDHVKVLYDGEWCLATIKKHFQKKSDGTFRYSVYYPEDGTTQSQVPESDIQLVQVDSLLEDPKAVAEEMGFPKGWQAKCLSSGNAKKKKWTFTSPDGQTFQSKATALRHQKKLEQGLTSADKEQPSTKKKKTAADLLSDEGDPPWRTTGHAYIGRHVLITTQHKKSATRTVEIEQVGQVLGWIASTDVDQHGNPGFVSERTNQPANLFHVVFDEETSHPYFSLLVESQDLEEYELQNVLVPLELDDDTKAVAVASAVDGNAAPVAAAPVSSDVNDAAAAPAADNAVAVASGNAAPSTVADKTAPVADNADNEKAATDNKAKGGETAGDGAGEEGKKEMA